MSLATLSRQRELTSNCDRLKSSCSQHNADRGQLNRYRTIAITSAVRSVAKAGQVIGDQALRQQIILGSAATQQSNPAQLR